jgi:hypothetical protein
MFAPFPFLQSPKLEIFKFPLFYLFREVGLVVS